MFLKSYSPFSQKSSVHIRPYRIMKRREKNIRYNLNMAQVAKLFKTLDLRKLGNMRKTSKPHRIRA